MASLVEAFPDKAVASNTRSCKICGNPASLFGVVDFNKICLEESLSGKISLSGIPIFYYQCQSCEFVFTPDLDNWSHDDFARHVYNDEYVTFDPGYVEERPKSSAINILKLFRDSKGELSLLDYGGGSGRLSELLRLNGFKAAVSYDPFSPTFGTMPPGRFDVVSCFETLEHHSNPMEGIADIAQRVDERGLVLFSTLVQPDGFKRKDIGWWYISPRNGHISIFSRRALQVAWAKVGHKVISLSNGLHVAYREMPSFAPWLPAQVEAAAAAASAKA